MLSGGNPEQDRIEFIRDCIKHDVPRLRDTVYPDDVTEVLDLCYEPSESGKGELRDHLYDVYYPIVDCVEGAEGGKINSGTAFLMIHGGAFVYGDKVNNRNFSMHISRRSGLPVININYRKLPDTDYCGMANDIAGAMEMICRKYEIDSLHLIGDSAGGYLALLAYYIAGFDEVRKELNISSNPQVSIKSVISVCGTYFADSRSFPGFFFEDNRADGRKETLPEYVYDLTKLVDRFGIAPTVIITGEDDFLRDENRAMFAHIKEKGGSAVFYEGHSREGQITSHIFPVVNPQWEESVNVIEMIVGYV